MPREATIRRLLLVVIASCTAVLMITTWRSQSSLKLTGRSLLIDGSVFGSSTDQGAAPAPEDLAADRIVNIKRMLSGAEQLPPQPVHQLANGAKSVHTSKPMDQAQLDDTSNAQEEAEFSEQVADPDVKLADAKQAMRDKLDMLKARRQQRLTEAIKDAPEKLPDKVEHQEAADSEVADVGIDETENGDDEVQEEEGENGPDANEGGIADAAQEPSETEANETENAAADGDGMAEEEDLVPPPTRQELYDKYLPNSPYKHMGIDEEIAQRKSRVLAHLVRTCPLDGCPSAIAWRYACAIESTLRFSKYDVVLSFQGARQAAKLLRYTRIKENPKWHDRVHVNILDVADIVHDTPLEPWYKDTFLQNKAGSFAAINLADGARLAIVYRYGGLYIDLDSVFVGMPQLEACGIQLFRSPNNAATNAFFYAPPKDKDIWSLMERFVYDYNGDKWGYQGPIMFFHEFGTWPQTACSPKLKRLTRPLDLRTLKSTDQKSDDWFPFFLSRRAMVVHYLNQFTANLQLGTTHNATVLAQVMRHYCPATYQSGVEFDSHNPKPIQLRDIGHNL